MLAEQKSHLVNLENAAAMLVDKYKSPQTQLEIKHVSSPSTTSVTKSAESLSFLMICKDSQEILALIKCCGI